MATVSARIAAEIIANDGYYKGDPRVLQVVRYTTMEGRPAYAILYEHDVRGDRYAPSPYVINPKVVWRAEP